MGRKSQFAKFTNEATIEVVAVEVLWFLANFGRETRLTVCERPKFAKSTKDAPKDELRHRRIYDCLTTFTASTIFFKLGRTSSHLRVFSPQSGFIHSWLCGRTSSNALICATISSTLGILGL